MHKIASFNMLLNQIRQWKDWFYIFYYRLFFFLKGIKIGEKSVFCGKMTLVKGKKTTLKIGNYFTCFSSSYKNPLCRNIESSICVNDDAVLIIGDHVGISSVCIWSHKSIKIGNNVAIGGGSILIDSDCHSLNYRDRYDGKLDNLNKCSMDIVIDDDVLIGTSCIILKGVHIGARAVIGSGSIVTKDIPSDCIAAGNPCRIIKKINR